MHLRVLDLQLGSELRHHFDLAFMDHPRGFKGATNSKPKAGYVMQRNLRKINSGCAAELRDKFFGPHIPSASR